MKKIYRNCASRTVTDTVVTETDSMKITSCFATTHAELAAGHWLDVSVQWPGKHGVI